MTQAEFFERFGETKQNICLRTDYFRPAEYISNKETDLTQQVTDALVRLGIPRHIKGFEYLRQAVILSVNDKTLIEHITKRLYPEVAAMFETTPSRVERAIRHAIEVGCSKDPDWMGLTFNRAMSVLSDKPVNSEFIATIADNIRLARQ
jgi:two-component system response regulator (stage 0 sporulation protein A)